MSVWALGWQIPWSRKWQPALVFLPGKFHGQWSLAGCSPWCRRELDMTEQLSKHTQAWMLLRKSDKKNPTQETYGDTATMGTCLLVQTGVRLKGTERHPIFNEQNSVLQKTNPENQSFLPQNIINPLQHCTECHLCVCMCVCVSNNETSLSSCEDYLGIS